MYMQYFYYSLSYIYIYYEIVKILQEPLSKVTDF